ncbi:MAG TPA: glutathione S-transferase family protein [Steroidobacteraceae bacterium]|nr:glutathione S-transferase family protein [Steroidobacteraceae bacterium]
MGVIEATSRAVGSLKGLHLYHAGRSNCSGRVRLLLEEKGLSWVSHYVDIYTKQNVSAQYFAINPKGVVPTLVHDGRVIVESNDILLYLEELYPAPPLAPEAPTEREAMRRWLQRSGDIHIPGIKTFAYAKLNAALVEKTPEEAALYRELQRDPDLLAFHAKHDPGKSFSAEDVACATTLLRATLAEIDANIARRGWLVGASYSLADISWSPTMTTLQRAGFPLGEFPHIGDWYRRIAQRPAWVRAITLWLNPTPELMGETRQGG